MKFCQNVNKFDTPYRECYIDFINEKEKQARRKTVATFTLKGVLFRNYVNQNFSKLQSSLYKGIFLQVFWYLIILFKLVQ